VEVNHPATGDWANLPRNILKIILGHLLYKEEGVPRTREQALCVLNVARTLCKEWWLIVRRLDDVDPTDAATLQRRKQWWNHWIVRPATLLEDEEKFRAKKEGRLRRRAAQEAALEKEEERRAGIRQLRKHIKYIELREYRD